MLGKTAIFGFINQLISQSINRSIYRQIG